MVLAEIGGVSKVRLCSLRKAAYWPFNQLIIVLSAAGQRDLIFL